MTCVSGCEQYMHLEPAATQIRFQERTMRRLHRTCSARAQLYPGSPCIRLVKESGLSIVSIVSHELLATGLVPLHVGPLIRSRMSPFPVRIPKWARLTVCSLRSITQVGLWGGSVGRRPE